MKDLVLTDAEAIYGCGVGQRAQCCKFLLLDENGFFCGRESELRQRLIDAPDYTAQRLPSEPYPLCQLVQNQEKVGS